MRPNLVTLASLALVSCSTDVDAPRTNTVQQPWSRSSTGVVFAASGGSVVAAEARVDVPAGALPHDLALTLLVRGTTVDTHALPERVTLSPEGVALAVPATLRVPLSAEQLAAADTLTAAMEGGDALPAAVVDGALVVTFSETGAFSFGVGACAIDCATGKICHAGTCVSECASDDDCPEVATCGLWLASSFVPRRHCDAALGACVDDGRDVTVCDGCDIETGACFPAGACPPPKRAWPGERGICLCGFPELHCAEPPEREGAPGAWVDAGCDSDADCADLGCTGLATCLRPGQRYPDGCFEQGMLRCYYEPSAPPGPCAAMCGEGR